MEQNKFNVGQKWKDRNDIIHEILHISNNEHYPIEGDGGYTWTINGAYFHTENSVHDLVELVKDSPSSKSKDNKFMDMATFIGDTFSKDRSTKVGCVIIGDGNSILSTGYNGFVRCSDDARDDWHERPMKYDVTEHAERNAIYNAARHGIKLKGSSIYISSMCPCVDCARAISQSGIAKVFLTDWAFSEENPRGQVWLEKWATAKEILDTADVEVSIISTA